jgi:ABC-2 type transport system permease protein
MNKLFVIIKREFLTRVRKRSFILMTILGPLLFAAIFLLPTYIMSLDSNELKKIAVIDSSGLFIGKIPETHLLKFEYLKNTSVEKIRKDFDKTDYYAVLYIAHIIHYSPNAVQLMSYKQPSLGVTMHISNAIEKEVERQKLKTYEIEEMDKILASVKTNVAVQNIKWARDGVDKSGNAGLAMIVAYLSGFLIYFFIFMFCTQVMRAVIEEKSNRIIEVIVSSVKPFQFMLGKICGIALVGLTQFILWIVLCFILFNAVSYFTSTSIGKIPVGEPVNDLFSNSTLASQQLIPNDKLFLFNDILQNIAGVDFTVMIIAFVFFFLAGYLLYASLFAAVGAMVDNETDTQQFLLPVTLPLILAIMVMLNTINNPDGNVSFWFSLFPFTSPIVMMARIPFGVPIWEVYLSAVLLVGCFILFTYLSARIYKTGLLMYGKKPSLKEVFKWLKESRS